MSAADEHCAVRSPSPVDLYCVSLCCLGHRCAQRCDARAQPGPACAVTLTQAAGWPWGHSRVCVWRCRNHVGDLGSDRLHYNILQCVL